MSQLPASYRHSALACTQGELLAAKSRLPTRSLHICASVIRGSCASRLLALLLANNTSVCPTMLARLRALLTTTFQNLSQSPQPRSQAAAAVDGTAWHVTGGVDSTGVATASTYRFDSTTRSWTTLAPLNYPRAGHGLVVVNRCALPLHVCDVILVMLRSIGCCSLLLCVERQ